MKNKIMNKLTPTDVDEVMNFNVIDKDWCYDSTDKSMPAKQVQGVAALWNILSKNNVALLADEVGMGKTYQAIGLMLLLWCQKPNARILVMAPNQTLCRNWEREFSNFIDKHYRYHSGSSIDFNKLCKEKYQPQILIRLKDLVGSVKNDPRYFYLTTIHALSGLVEDKETENKYKAAQASANLYREQIMGAINGAFDLVIIDEAHYLRNKGGDSQRAAAASAFFGKPNAFLAKKALLLTATPNHSSENDVYNILSYFTSFPEDTNSNNVQDLMRKYAIRRLRKMKGKEGSYNKYHYRREQTLPANFKNNIEAELFFALYQKKLVDEFHELKEEKRSFMYGYLEGFESVGRNHDIENKNEYDDEEMSESFNKASDSNILKELTCQFNRIYHRFPDHPKYNVLVDTCVSNELFSSQEALHKSKHLIFVRRIPSVKEITQRINEKYDEIMAARILKAWGVPKEKLKIWRRSNWARSTFDRFIQNKKRLLHKDEVIRDIDFSDGDETENKFKLSSKIAALFSVKQHDQKHRRTDCTNVSLRFRNSESLFSLFLEPALDGEQKGYCFYYRQCSGKKERDTYREAARDKRLNLSIPNDCEERNYGQELTTAWAMMFELLPEPAKNKIIKWINQKNGHHIIENFANYLRQGYIFASPVMIEIYCWYTEFNLSTYTKNKNRSLTDVKERYSQFTQWVKKKLPYSLMYRYFISAIETFEILCEKIVGNALTDFEYSWRELTSLNSPAWYASGETTNRERLITGFNSPFYPNVLAATSVFKEGVNLHLQCHQVHHYGIAWTPGDNEQRNGRIDRLFGKINTLLQEKDDAEMIINYPYLEGTFDEDQLASFIYHKYSAEDQLDSCDTVYFNQEIDPTKEFDDWQSKLRQPNKESETEDPYPALFE